MATARDVQDIFGLDKAQQPAPKKQKIAHAPPGKRLTGLNREVHALHGDRPPPVVVQDVSKTYKAKPKKDFKPRKW